MQGIHNSLRYIAMGLALAVAAAAMGQAPPPPEGAAAGERPAGEGRRRGDGDLRQGPDGGRQPGARQQGPADGRQTRDGMRRPEGGPEGGPPRQPGQPGQPPGGGPGFGPGGPGPGGPGPGGPGGNVREPRRLLEQFDSNGDGWLNSQERAPAREKIRADRPAGRGFGGRGGFGRPNAPAPEPGEKLAPGDVAKYPDAPLYDPGILRTLFLDFEEADWEAELADFRGTDVEVPARLTVDGAVYPNVGVRFRGASSYMMVPAGLKRSFNVSIDMADDKQRLGGYKTLNLLNSNGDPTMLRGLLFLHVARHYIPAPRGNLVKVVVNGESWGIYPSVQQFNKEFINDWFQTTKGARWKVPGSPRGGGGLTYLGEDIAPYRTRYEIKSGDNEKSWKALIELCRVLNQTPIDQLEKALEPILDIEGVLRFLALDNVFINTDGYWIRDSDYSLYRHPEGRFHLIPHDANETFMMPGGPGMGRGERISGVELDPLIGLSDERKPLRSRLLQVPALRARYLELVGEINEQWVNWEKLGPVVKQYADLIEREVEKDTRKLDSATAFRAGIGSAAAAQPPAPGPGRRPQLSLKDFVEQRRAYLSNHAAVKEARAALANQKSN
jgi:hypothetical protein